MNESQNSLFMFNTDKDKKVYNIAKTNQTELDKIIEDLENNDFKVKKTIRFSNFNSSLYNKVIVKWFKNGELIGSFTASKLNYIEDNYWLPLEDPTALTIGKFESLIY